MHHPPHGAVLYLAAKSTVHIIQMDETAPVVDFRSLRSFDPRGWRLFV